MANAANAYRSAERVIDQVACDLLVLQPATINAVRRERLPRQAAIRPRMTKRRGKRIPVQYAG
jgi:hypothetical protein